VRLSLLRLALLSAPLALTACGDGWEVVKTTDYFPYGNKRTAGSGTAYVLAKMLPEKELKLETETAIEEPAAAKTKTEPKPALKAEKIFNDAQTKGAPSPKAAPSDVKTETDEDDVKGASLEKNDTSQALLAQDLGDTPSSDNDSEVSVSSLEPSAGGRAPSPPQSIYPNRVIEPSHVISMPEDHIISPKVDIVEYITDGERSLEQIYRDDF